MCSNRINLLNLKQSLGRQVIVTKGFLKLPKPAYTNKTKESITSQKLCLQDFWQIVDSVLNKGSSAILPLFNGPEVSSSASDKAKLFAKIFSKNSL